jgi:hypothetical protein
MPIEETKRALIVVRTYPVPVPRGIESSSTAAITEAGEWLRLFPVPWRLLPTDQRFRKYQWVNVTVAKATDDSRRESFKLRPDGIRVLSDPLPNWKAKQDLVMPLRAPSLCGLIRTRDLQQYPTLGVFRPASISRLRIVPDAPNWSQGELEMLQQSHLFVDAPKQQLEKIPFRFIYQFGCEEAECRGHNLMCTDWEISQAYRQWRSDYGNDWEAKFRLRFETEMIEKYDTHFFVGTVSSHPNRWIIIGLFYPPRDAQVPLF